jgi:hypothetical protein
VRNEPSAPGRTIDLALTDPESAFGGKADDMNAYFYMSLATGEELAVIAATVIGGVNLSGGEGAGRDLQKPGS